MKQLLIAMALLASTASAGEYYGWTPDKAATNRFKQNNARPYYGNWAQTGTKRGRVVLLVPFLELATGQDFQSRQQGYTDCVGQAFGLGVDVLTGVQIHLHGANERWIAPASAEAIYGGSRVNVAHRHGGYGAVGAWAAEWVRDYGVILQVRYDGWDLREYDPRLSKRWGRAGIPRNLVREARAHPVQTVSLVTSWEDVRDAVCNGYPVVLCSRQGFNSRIKGEIPERDQDGFLRPYGIWGHAMCVVGVTDRERPGALVANSWGDHWVRGPPGFYCPPGCFWVDASVIHSMVSEEDSFALSGYVGYPRIDGLDYQL